MSSAGNNWKTVAPAVVCILALIGYFYRDTLSGMAEIWWRSETYAHGLVVPAISAWLIWQKRDLLSHLDPKPAIWPVLIVVIFTFSWLLGELTAMNALTQFSVVAIIVSSSLALFGSGIGKKLAFPLGFLFFAVPIGDFLLPNLMEWTADFTVSALRFSNIPVYREGQSFVIPSGHWSVVEACSGIRYMIASVTVGTLYAYLTYTSLKRRLTFVLVSFVVPLVANWLRAYMIVMLGHLSGNKLAVGVDHLIYGWIFFGVVIAVMFAIGMRWAEPPAPSVPDNASPTVGIPPLEYRHDWLVLAALAMAIMAGPVAEKMLRRPNSHAEPAISLPAEAGGWLSGKWQIDWKPRFINPSGEYRASFSKGDQHVGIYIAYYRNQAFEKKLVTSTNVLVMSNDEDWQQVLAGKRNVEFQTGMQEIRTAELLKRSMGADDRYVIWRWYWINGQITSSEIKAKWLTALSILSGHGDDGAAIILYASKPESSKDLQDFAREVIPHVHQTLSEVARQ